MLKLEDVIRHTLDSSFKYPRLVKITDCDNGMFGSGGWAKLQFDMREHLDEIQAVCLKIESVTEAVFGKPASLTIFHTPNYFPRTRQV